MSKRAKQVRNEYTDKAQQLGKEAFDRGVKCAPCLDKQVMQMIAAKEYDTIALLDAWTHGWHAANLTA